MQMTPLGNDIEVAVWERAIQSNGALSQAAARALLKLKFSPQDERRMRQLSEAARAGTLMSAEQSEIDAYEQLGCLLDVLHSQARRVLKKRRVAS